jgi:hypothetical protein
MREPTIPVRSTLRRIELWGGGSSGVVDSKDLDANIAGRDVLVVEDIIDPGLTPPV